MKYKIKHKEILILIGVSLLFILTLPVSLFMLGVLWILFIEDIEEVVKENNKNHNQ